MDRRILIGIALALTAGWIIMELEFNQGAAYPAADASVTIDGPDGVIWTGNVTAQEGTAFHALLAAGIAGEFRIEWTGIEGNRFVTSIAGIGEGGGWCVQVNGDDSPVSVDRFPVHDGDSVRWYWTDDQCEKF